MVFDQHRTGYILRATELNYYTNILQTLAHLLREKLEIRLSKWGGGNAEAFFEIDRNKS